ncbi:hypothetical protein GQR58_002406 [Nymphon striatum]|nr:hypothetical protein GQR58_002406 [Nymphon striatum]
MGGSRKGYLPRPLIHSAICTDLQNGSYASAVYSVILSLFALALAIFDMFCVGMAYPGSVHIGYYSISFIFVYSGNPHSDKKFFNFLCCYYCNTLSDSHDSVNHPYGRVKKDNSDVDYEPMESYESDDADLSEHEDDGVMLSGSWKRISDIFSDCRPNSLPELVRNFSGVNPALNCNANNSVLDCFKKFITNDVIVLSCDRIARSAGATPLEHEQNFRPWLYTMATFTVWRVIATIAVSIANDLYFTYHQLVLFFWIVFLSLNAFCLLVVFSNYQELEDITRLEDMAKLKMGTMSSLNTSHSMSRHSVSLHSWPNPSNSRPHTPHGSVSTANNSRPHTPHGSASTATA